MITKDELREYAKLRALNLGQAEKDYFQNIILFMLYQKYGSELIFKGGTALNKCYGLNRFSEDLDFTGKDIGNMEELVEMGLRRFLIEFEIQSKKYPDGLKVILRLRGPLYVGIRQSLCRFEIDLSLRENVILEPNVKTIGRFLEEVPVFDVFVMQEKEILAEKIGAILTRNYARDVYDLWFLLERDIKPDIKLIKEKLKYYGEAWDLMKFKKKLMEKKDVWEKELKPLVLKLPKFKEVMKSININITKGES